MKAFRKILIMLLVLCLLLSIAPAAFAAEVTEGDTYVLNRDKNSDFLYQYQSCYTIDYDNNGSKGWTQIWVYTMYNTISKVAIPAYCIDQSVTAERGVNYRRLNLEDSSYSATVAGKIRAIVLEGFYIRSDNEQADGAKAKLAELGAASGVEGLTASEAIVATQTAIWQAVHGPILKFPDFFRGYISNISQTKYAALCKEDTLNGHIEIKDGKVTNDALIGSRIEAVYNYLLSLDPVGPSSKTVSPAAFTNLTDPVFTPNEDGTYNVEITTTVDVEMTGDDSLTLEATLGGFVASTSLRNGTQTVTLTLPNVPEDLCRQDVTLTISGYQTASDVFLFDAEGERGSAQTMVGMDNSQLPVYAEVTVHENRVLKVQKTSTGGRPLEGIVFNIYRVGDMADYPNLPDPETVSYPEMSQYSVITDKNGMATFDFTQQGLPDGVYLVVEQAHPAIISPIKPFYLMVPMPSVNASGYDYVINIQPKNDVKGRIDIDKDVISLGQDEASVEAYENHTWIISATVPEDIASGKYYWISDTLDNRLDYKGNVRVTVETADGETVAATLKEGVDYILTVNDVDSLSENKPSDSLEVSLTGTGRSAVATAIGNNAFSDYKVRVYFDAQINANAQIAERIPNQAKIKYTNSVNFDFDKESDKPEVYTGGINLLKVDSLDRNRTLSGAVFEVYRPATPDETFLGVDYLENLEGISEKVVKMSFFTNQLLTGDKVTSVTSDENGRIAIYGLRYGDYYLKEIQSPAGYNLLGEPAKVTIDANSHKEENVIVIENISGTVLPETGGIGTEIYTFTGIALLAIGALLLLKKRRSHSAAN